MPSLKKMYEKYEIGYCVKTLKGPVIGVGRGRIQSCLKIVCNVVAREEASLLNSLVLCFVKKGK